MSKRHQLGQHLNRRQAVARLAASALILGGHDASAADGAGIGGYPYEIARARESR